MYRKALFRKTTLNLYTYTCTICNYVCSDGSIMFSLFSKYEISIISTAFLLVIKSFPKCTGLMIENMHTCVSHIDECHWKFPALQVGRGRGLWHQVDWDVFKLIIWILESFDDLWRLRDNLMFPASCHFCYLQVLCSVLDALQFCKCIRYSFSVQLSINVLKIYLMFARSVSYNTKSLEQITCWVAGTGVQNYKHRYTKWGMFGGQLFCWQTLCHSCSNVFTIQ